LDLAGEHDLLAPQANDVDLLGRPLVRSAQLVE
jgi:hypothetical protein